MNDDNYLDVVVKFYDLIYDQKRSSVDVDYYLSKIAASKKGVLEIGVGTGRIFLKALDLAIDIHGIDLSKRMIAMLTHKLDKAHAGRISLQDVRSFDLQRKFDLIIAPFRLFSHLHTITDQLAALDSIYKHLHPGGRLIFDVYVPNFKTLSMENQEKLDFDGIDEQGKPLKRITSSKVDTLHQLNHITMKFEWGEAKEVQTTIWELKMRYYFRYELELLIRLSKFQLDHIYGDFHENELTADSKEFVLVCSKQ